MGVNIVSTAPSFPATTESQIAPNGPLSESQAASIATATDPALVDIEAMNNDGTELMGTGVVVTSNGEVLTNNHVIAGATSFRVVDVGNGQTYDATVIGYDRAADLAVLSVDNASGLTTAQFSDSSTVQVGDGVVAVGNANGAEGTPRYASGTITGAGQTTVVQDKRDGTSWKLSGAIETDASMVPGDSGGALVDRADGVIGILTAGTTNLVGEAVVSEGYVIPINQARKVASEIVAGESSSTIHIGATASLGVKVGAPTFASAGAEIVNLDSGGTGAAAGLQIGDTIMQIGGHLVSSPETFGNFLARAGPGETVQVRYLDQLVQSHLVMVQLTGGPPQ